MMQRDPAVLPASSTRGTPAIPACGKGVNSVAFRNAFGGSSFLKLATSQNERRLQAQPPSPPDPWPIAAWTPASGSLTSGKKSVLMEPMHRHSGVSLSSRRLLSRALHECGQVAASITDARGGPAAASIHCDLLLVLVAVVFLLASRQRGTSGCQGSPWAMEFTIASVASGKHIAFSKNRSDHSGQANENSSCRAKQLEVPLSKVSISIFQSHFATYHQDQTQ